jgi:hypothetical protein
MKPAARQRTMVVLLALSLALNACLIIAIRNPGHPSAPAVLTTSSARRENPASAHPPSSAHVTPGAPATPPPESAVPRDQPKTVQEFLDKFNSMDNSLTGKELSDARSQVISLSAEILTIEEQRTLADSLRNKVYHSSVACSLAFRYADSDRKAGMEWLIQESKFDGASSAPLIYALRLKFDTFPADDLARFGNDAQKAQLIEGMMGSATIEVTRQALIYLKEHPEVDRQNGNLTPLCFDSSMKAGKYQDTLSLYTILEDPYTKAQILGQVFTRASASDPKLAQDLLKTVKGEQERNIAIRNIAESWGLAEPDKVASWVNNLPGANEQDAAKEGLVTALMNSDPSSSLEWARSISDQGRREKSLAELRKIYEITHPGLLK